MAQLYLSLKDCQILLDRLIRLRKKLEVFYEIPKNEDEILQLTPVAHIIINALADAFKLNIRIGPFFRESKTSLKEVDNLIDSLTEVFANM